MAKVILDISHHETVKDWKKLKDSVYFLIFKATEGTSFLDPKCYETIKQCEKYKIPYWLYCFLKKGDELAQAKYMVSKCKPKVGSHFVGYCIDVERGNSAASVQKALDYIKTQSKKVMIYTAHQHYDLYKSLVAKRGANCAWWEPRYNLKAGPHAGVDLWQYSESYKCSYISGEVDINKLRGKSKPLSWFTTPTPKTVKTGVKKTPDILLTQARSWIGCKESDGSHKKIIDLYNSYRPLPRGYKVKYTDAWCATFVSACVIASNYVDLIPIECSCAQMIKLAQKMGVWVEDEKRTPNPGDLILYDWQDSGKGDNKGTPDHVGLVEKVTDGTITVIEGNYKDAVGRRTIKVNGKGIRGYIVPKYDK